MKLHDILKRQSEGMSISSYDTDIPQKGVEGDIPLVEYRGVLMLQSDYEALENIASEVGGTVDDLYVLKVFAVAGGSVSTLDLTEYGLTKVPESVDRLTNLKDLILDGNQLTQVPNFNLPNLVGLDLDNNQLTQIPDFDLPTLEYLNIESNQLTQVPDFNLPNLKELCIDSNKLTQIPDDFNLPNLQELWARGNNISREDTRIKELEERGVNVTV